MPQILFINLCSRDAVVLMFEKNAQSPINISRSRAQLILRLPEVELSVAAVSAPRPTAMLHQEGTAT